MTSGRRYRYLAVHALTGELLDGDLRLIKPSWTRTVNGNGELSSSIVVPERRDVEGIAKLKRALSQQSAIYVQRVSTGEFVWGGLVLRHEWDDKAQLAITCAHWRHWFYGAPLVPDPATGRDIYYRWDGDDQLDIVRDVASEVLGEPGSPSFSLDDTLSGRLRNYGVYGTELKSAGEIFEQLGGSADGFEWDVELSVGVDGLPVRTLTTYYPQRGITVPGAIFALGRNIMDYDSVVTDYSTGASRVWALGSGEPPDRAFAVDTAADIATTVRREQSRSFSSTSDRAILAGHAQRVRRVLGVAMDTIDITVKLDDPDVDSYNVGDRVALRIKDRWVDIDEQSVRIVAKGVDTSGAGSCDLTLDLSDLTEPETDGA